MRATSLSDIWCRRREDCGPRRSEGFTRQRPRRSCCQARNDSAMRPQAQVGITLATGIMYLRILILIAIFNLSLASRLALALVTLSLAALLICAFQYWRSRPFSKSERISLVKNPLELGAAAT